MTITITLLIAGAALLTSTAALRWSGRRLVHRLWPAVAVPVLAAGALINAGSLLVLCGLLAVAVVGRWAAVAPLGGWSPEALAADVPEPVFVGLAAAAAVMVFGGRTIWFTGRLLFRLGHADRCGRRLRGRGGPIVFVDDPAGDAYTMAGVRGCVVISRHLFDALDPSDRRVLLAHELSHLRRRHHLYVHAVDAAATANPLLRPLGPAVRLGVERWADEDAAAAGDRAGAGRALARTALVQAGLRRCAAIRPSAGPATRLGVATGDVPTRAHALLDRPAPRHHRVLLALVTLLVLTSLGTATSMRRIHEGLEHAEIGHHTAHADHRAA